MEAKRRLRLIASILALLVGLAGGFLVRQLVEGEETDDAELAAVREARTVLAQEEDRHQVLLAQNDELEARKKSLLSRLEDFDDASAVLAEMRQFALLSGMTDVEGSGIRISLDDRLDYDPLTDPIESVIHDSTINYVLNLLWSAGARAISFNGVRLTAISEVSCVGPTILCYGIRQMPPYLIEAIGPEEEMKNALETDSYLLYLTQDKIGVRLAILRDHQMRLPSFSRTQDYLPYIDLLRTP